MNTTAFLDGYMNKTARSQADSKLNLARGSDVKRLGKKIVNKNISRSKLPEELKPVDNTPVPMAVEVKKKKT